MGPQTQTTSKPSTPKSPRIQTSTTLSTPKSPSCAQPVTNSQGPAKLKAGPKSFKERNAVKPAAKSGRKPAPAKKKPYIHVNPYGPLTDTYSSFEDVSDSTPKNPKCDTEEYYAQQRALGFKVMAP
jgi:hypothetical protein